eukprot:SAG11_NODE_373_length_10031_cov_37.400020_9_plen_58_part_00
MLVGTGGCWRSCSLTLQQRGLTHGTVAYSARALHTLPVMSRVRARPLPSITAAGSRY